jgi:hypothetical protein
MPTLTYVGGTSASYTSLLTPKVVSYTATAGNLLVVDVWDYDGGTAVPLTISDNGSGVWGVSNVNYDLLGSGSNFQFYSLSAASGITTISLAGTAACSGVITVSEYSTTTGYWNLDQVTSIGSSASSQPITLPNIYTSASNLVVHGAVTSGTYSGTFSGSGGYTLSINQSSSVAAVVMGVGHGIQTSSGTYAFAASLSASGTSSGFATSFSVTSGAPTLGSIPQTNLVGWYMANQGVNWTGSGTNIVENVIDWSGQGNTLYYPLGNSMGWNTNQINGLPAIQNIGGYLLFNSSINLQSTGLTLFLVGQLSQTTNKNSFFSGPSGSFVYWSCASGTGPALQGADKSQVAQLPYGNAIADLNWHQINVTYNGAGTTIAYRKDETSDGGGSTSNALSANQTTIGLNNGSEPWQGYWAEFIIYNAVLNSTQIGQVETYLQQKYFPVVVTYRLLPLLGVGI